MATRPSPSQEELEFVILADQAGQKGEQFPQARKPCIVEGRVTVPELLWSSSSLEPVAEALSALLMLMGLPISVSNPRVNPLPRRGSIPLGFSLKEISHAVPHH